MEESPDVAGGVDHVVSVGEEEKVAGWVAGWVVIVGQGLQE